LKASFLVAQLHGNCVGQGLVLAGDGQTSLTGRAGTDEPGQLRNVSLRTGLRSATLEETQGLTGGLDDELRVGTTLRVAYSTRPPDDVDTVGPMLRRHVTTMRTRAEAK
jgi:hypothetical protein